MPCAACRSGAAKQKESKKREDRHMSKTMIKNGNLVFENRTVRADLVIENGKIAEIALDAQPGADCTVIDAAGKMVLPGMIDTHSHVTDPGPYNYREDWKCASKSAASGGITTIADMPLPSIAVLNQERFQEKLAAVRSSSVVDFALWGGVTPLNIDKLEEMNESGCIGYKGFMCFATKEYPQITDGYLVEGLKKVKEFDGLIAVHAENAEVADMGCKRFSAAGCTDEAQFDEARPWWVEYEAIQRATLFAKVTGAKLMVCHVSIPEGAELLKELKAQGARVYAETCPHYLLFDKTVLREKKAFAKCTPPFRARESVEKLWDYVKDGTIDVIGTDHGPFTDEEKGEKGDFWKEYCGFGCNDAVMAAMVTEGIHKRGLSWNRLVSLTSGNAARMFGIYPQKGNLLPGADADIQIIDPDREWVYDGLKSYSKTKSDKGVYQNMRFKGKVVAALVRGRLVYDGEGIVAPEGYGEFVRRV